MWFHLRTPPPLSFPPGTSPQRSTDTVVLFNAGALLKGAIVRDWAHPMPAVGLGRPLVNSDPVFNDFF